ncbi:hypothetical protein HDU67_002092, partial [Dinochytrium kinnereticum]
MFGSGKAPSILSRASKRVAPDNEYASIAISRSNSIVDRKKSSTSSASFSGGNQSTPLSLLLDDKKADADQPKHPELPGLEKWRNIWIGSKTLVWRAYDAVNDRPVIVKVNNQPHPDLVAIQSLKSEFAMIQHLHLNPTSSPISGSPITSHHNLHTVERESTKILTAYAMIPIENRGIAIIMNDLGGESLTIWLKNARSRNFSLPQPVRVRERSDADVGFQNAATIRLASGFSLLEVVDVAVQICSGLDYIHERKVIHKDLTPNNIIISMSTGEITAQIIDFSISSFTSSQNAVVTIPEGTLCYMAPEQTGRFNRKLDFRTDLYSLGCTLYCLLLNKRPFEDFEDDEMSLIHAHIARPIKPPSEVNPKIPTSLSDIVCKLMEKAPENRYQSAFGLLKDLQWIHRTLKKEPLAKAYSILSTMSLGRWDVSTTFTFPEVLLGRENELERMVGLFKATCEKGTSSVLVVAGTCFEEALKKILASSESELQASKIRIQKTVKRYDLLFQYLPDLESIMKFSINPSNQASNNHATKATATFLNPLSISTPAEQSGSFNLAQSQIILNQAFADLASVLTTTGVTIDEDSDLTEPVVRSRVDISQPAVPVCMFLDDLQWADLATLMLLQFIIVSARCRNLFIIVAYRDNEVLETKGHPLITAIESISKKGQGAVENILLGPLDHAAVLKYVASTLK